MLKVPFIKPSKEKILREFVSMAILVLIVLINSEKQMSFWNKVSPKLRIASEMLEFMSTTNSIKKKEKFIAIPNKINLMRKLKGASVCV